MYRTSLLDIIFTVAIVTEYGAKEKTALCHITPPLLHVCNGLARLALSIVIHTDVWLASCKLKQRLQCQRGLISAAGIKQVDSQTRLRKALQLETNSFEYDI